MTPDIISQAKKEVADENYRAAVEREKTRLRAKRSIWWHLNDLLPFTIIITRKPK